MAQPDPYADIADPVTIAQSGNDPYAQIAAPAKGAEQQPGDVVSIQAPDDVANGLLSIWNDPNGTPDQYINFAAQHGYAVDPEEARHAFANIHKGSPRGQDVPAQGIVGAPQPRAPDETVGPARQAISDAIFGAIDDMAPGVGSFLKTHSDSGKALTEHYANGLGGDYGPEVGGFLKTVADPGGYDNFGQNLKDNIASERAILEHDSQGHPIASALGELGGAATAAPLAGGALDAIPAIADAAEIAPKLTAAAKASAGGAVYGSGAAGPGNRAEGAAIGAGVGGATQAALPIAISAIAGRAAGKAANQEFAQAASRQGVDYMAADLPNAPKSKFATALNSLTFGGIPLAEQGEKNVASAAAATNRVASDIGSVTDKTGAGQAAQRGAKQFIASTEGKMGDLYDAIPIPSESPAAVSNTRSALNALTQSFQSNPKLAAAFQNPQISKYLDALTPQTTKEATGLVDANGNAITRDVVHGGGLSWNDLKEFRTRVGKIIGQPGLTTDGQQISDLRNLYAALSSDMKSTASDFGPRALDAFNRANTYARARSNRIENVVSMILGNDNNKAPQSAFEAMQRLASDKGGDAPKLARVLRSMPDEEANTVRATMLDNLGSASPGHQNATGDVFSPAQFVTSWNKLSERAKSVLFTGDHRQALNDLANVFSGMKSSTKFANSSKTGLYVAGAHTAAVSIANPVLGALDAALQYGGGKLLSSPAFARRVAGTPLNAVGAKAYWARPWVQKMALKNPSIAAEIQGFQSAFLHANDNAGTLSGAAASPNSNSPDQQQQP